MPQPRHAQHLTDIDCYRRFAGVESTERAQGGWYKIRVYKVRSKATYLRLAILLGIQAELSLCRACEARHRIISILNGIVGTIILKANVGPRLSLSLCSWLGFALALLARAHFGPCPGCRGPRLSTRLDLLMRMHVFSSCIVGLAVLHVSLAPRACTVALCRSGLVNDNNAVHDDIVLHDAHLVALGNFVEVELEVRSRSRSR